MERLSWCSFFTFLLVLPQGVLSTYYYPTVFWTHNNCRFNLNKPDHKSSNPNGYYLGVKQQSHMFFICPHIAIWADTSSQSPHHGRMSENILFVDKDSYESCSVRNTSSSYHKEILRCDQSPMKMMYAEEIFSKYRAFPNRVTYTPGKDYYFISTSNGTIESLNNTDGGHCKTHHMKLHIHVCGDHEKCDFKMPKCPFTDEKHSSITGNSTKTNKTTKTTPKPDVHVPASEQVKGPEWLTKSMHMTFHYVAAALIFILIVSLVCVIVCMKRKPKTMKDHNLEKSSVEGRPIIRQESV